MTKAIFFIFAATIFITPLIILPLTIDYYHPPKELFTQLSLILCLAFWLINGIREARLHIARTNFYSVLVLLCVISGISLLWAKSKYLGLADYLQFLTYIGAFFICVNIVNRQWKALVLARVAFAAGCLSALYAISEYFWRFKLYSTFGNPDFLANYLVLIFPLGVVFYIWTEEFFKKFLLLLALAIVYGALLATFSVGAILGLFLGAGLICPLIIIEKTRLRKSMSQDELVPNIGKGVLALIIALVILTLFFFVENRFNPSPIIRQPRASLLWREGLHNRLISYRAAYRMVRDNPIFGVGLGNYKLRFPEYRGRWLAAQQEYFDSLTLDKERDKHVHNDLLQVWAETGIFGFIVFILVFLTMFKNAIFLYYDLLDQKKRLFVLGLLWSVSAYLAHSLFSFPMHVVPNGLLFWTLVGLLFVPIARRDTDPIILNIGPREKILLETGVIVMVFILCIWPVSIYLSEVFLKRMAGFDKKGMFGQALVEAETSLFFNPNSNAVVYIGNYAALNGDYETAGRSFAMALKNNDEINLHIALAEIYYKERLPRDCISEYMKALVLNPSSWHTRLRLAELYVENKMYDEAQLECQFILMNNVGDEDIKNRMAGILNKIFDKRILSDNYGGLQVNK